MVERLSTLIWLPLLWVVSATAVLGAATSKGGPPLPADLAALEARLAAGPTNVTILLRVALEYHNAAALGGDTAPKLLQQARGCLETVLRQEPRNAFARTLLGSTTVLSAREAVWIGTRIRRVREGLALMDAALKDDPDDADARFTRAGNNLFLPDFFERRPVVRADYDWLQARADRGEFAADFRQYVFLYHGFALQRWGDRKRARELWEAGLAIDRTSTVADELRQELAGKSGLSRLNTK